MSEPGFLSRFTALARWVGSALAPVERIQFAALPYRQTHDGVELLLVTSRQSGRWLIPKGWPLKNGDPISTVIAEAWEEAGLRGEVGPNPLGEYIYRKELDAGHEVRCRVVVYPFAVSSMAQDYPEAGIRKREWVSTDEAAKRVHETGLRDFLRNETLA